VSETLEPEGVASRESFAAYVRGLSAELAARPAYWENVSLGDFLRALAAYADDVPGYLANSGSPVDAEQPSWQLFAVLLTGARVYE
jgi:hypothetical protein